MYRVEHILLVLRHHCEWQEEEHEKEQQLACPSDHLLIVICFHILMLRLFIDNHQFLGL